jgi:hypothetical protein
MKFGEKSRALPRFAVLACRVAGLGLMFLAMDHVAHAAGAPEIDPGSLSSGMALLAGGMLWLSGRRPRK